MSVFVGRIICITLACIFAIIAIPTYLCGCHDVIQPNCIRYDITNTTVIYTLVHQRVCSECDAYDDSCSESCTGYGEDRSCTESCTRHCSHTREYDCFDSYVITSLTLHGVDRTCEINAASNKLSYDDAYNIAVQTYPMNSTFQIYVDKASGSCFTTSNVEALAITGLVFTLLSGCMIFATVMLYLLRLRRK